MRRSGAQVTAGQPWLWGRDWYLGLKEPGISTRSINVVDVATQRALGVCWVAW